MRDPSASRAPLPPLYPWQREAISLVAESGKSLCYTAPTGGGKSRVADELLALKLQQPTSGKALVILPYVALVREKVASLERVLRGKVSSSSTSSRGLVRGYAGAECEGVPLSGRERVAVCTIEKASSAVNRMFERGEIDRLVMVIVDELHMVSEDERGATLENCLTKIRHGVKSGKVKGGGPQVVAMSATVAEESLRRLAKWLDAETYVSTHRPVELREHVVTPNGVYVKEGGGDLRWVCEAPSVVEAEIITELVGQVYSRAHSSLVFCSSRSQCSSFAQKLCHALRGLNTTPGMEDAREECVQQLVAAAEGSPDPTLVECIRGGVAWHHAGLASAEKDVVEAGFRSGAILALTCTTTLAAGVNLPARRCVILRGFIAGAATPSMAQYKQMAGRAGRKGQSDLGESFLVITKSDAFDWARNLVCGELPPLESRLFPPSKGNDDLPCTAEQRRLYLESIACGVLKSQQDSGALAHRTFAMTSGTDAKSILARQDKSLREIHDKGLVRTRWCEGRAGEIAEWCSSSEGFAFYKSSLPIAHAQTLRIELEHALRHGLDITSKTHLLYFCIPREANFFANNLNWRVWSDWLNDREELYNLGENHLEITRIFAERAQHRPGTSEEARRVCAKHERLAAASLLNELLSNDATSGDIARSWGPLIDNHLHNPLDRGKIQSLQKAASTTAGMASVLCVESGWHSLAGLLQNVSEELAAGARRELLPLMSLDGMTGARARALHSAGFTTPAKIAALGPTRFDKLQDAVMKSLSRTGKSTAGLDQALRTTSWRVASNLVDCARGAIKESREALREIN